MNGSLDYGPCALGANSLVVNTDDSKSHSAIGYGLNPSDVLTFAVVNKVSSSSTNGTPDSTKIIHPVNTGINCVIGVDIERTGVFSENATIGIGMSLVDQDCREVDSLFLAGYVEGEAKFEQRSYDEFWSKNLDNLKQLTYHGPLSYAERQREMIVKFQQFRSKYPDAMLVTDNNLFDAAYINQLIERWTSDLPIPYKGSHYSNCWETHSMQKGFLLALGDAVGTDSWGFSKRMQELFNLPPMIREYSHNPVDDAYSIAYDMQAMLGVHSGRFKRK